MIFLMSYQRGTRINPPLGTVTTNKELDEWDDIFEEEMLTRAIIDRIMHHVTVFNIKGKSYLKHLSRFT